MKSCLIGLGMMCVLCTVAIGQHYPMFSQYMHNQLVINPAYTGSRDVLSLCALGRMQWAGMSGAPNTEALYFHTPLKDPRNNLGFNLLLDQIGVTSRSSFLGSYAYRIDFGDKKGRLAFGLQGGIATLQNRFSRVSTDVDGDVVFQSNSIPIVVPSVGFGVYYDTRKWYLGLSVPYLLEYHSSAFNLFVQQNDSNGSSRPIQLASGCVIRLNPDVLLRPSVLVKYVLHSPLELDLNANMILKDALWIGAGYRTNDALVGMVGYQINQQLRFGYSYDLTTTKLRRFNNGSHELMIRYEFGYKVKAMSPRYF